MKKQVRSQVALAVVLALSGAMGFAQTGAAVYKAHCQMCHGTSGTPSPGIAKMMGIKTASEYKDSEKVMIDAVTNGKGKMKSFSGTLSGAEITDAVAYFRTLK
ncbi:MAG: cytochrome c [Terracidiphilus sp.]